MQIKVATVIVDSQDNALSFYTGVLGFEKCADLPVGPFRWLTVTSPEGAMGVELILASTDFPPAQAYQKALFAAGIAAIAFTTNDIDTEYRRLKDLGVNFRGVPMNMGPIKAVSFDDSCGNLVNLVQPLV